MRRAEMRAAAGAGIVALLAWGCAGGGDGEAGQEPATDAEPEAGMAEDTTAMAPPRVMIVEPADGAELDPGPVRVVMAVEGLDIVPAGNMDAGTGHHHLVVNGEVAWSMPIPNDQGVHHHMGQAQTEYMLEGLGPGEHRIIAVVADGVHVPLDPPVADTVTVVVR